MEPTKDAAGIPQGANPSTSSAGLVASPNSASLADSTTTSASATSPGAGAEPQGAMFPQKLSPLADRAAVTAWHTWLMERALAGNNGNRSWNSWKQQAAEDLLALANASPRMRLLELFLDGELDAVYEIAMPVPRWPLDDQLVIGCKAIFHLRYEESWRWEPAPSWAPIGLVSPMDPFHSNARPALRGAICLGQIAPGTQPKQLVCSAYEALTLQDYALDESDPAGVMNAQACEFFRAHPEYCPLTTAGLCDHWSPPEVGAPGLWQR